MRQIGHIDNDKDARTFGDYLYVEGIETNLERDGERWAVWVHSDDDLARAKEFLRAFQANPADPKFQAGSPAEKMRQKAKEEDEAYRKRMMEGRKVIASAGSYGFGYVTYALIAACILVAVLSGAGENTMRISALFLTSLADVGRGEVWRLVTPMLIHFGIIHILFNMMWLRDLGSMFEGRLGSLYFALFVLVTAMVSNTAQYYFKGPNFGGMSGVNYALIGYAWMRGRFDPGAGIFLDRQSLILALIWFGACLLGVVHAANYAHAGGLFAGMLWGFLDSKRRS